MGAGEKFVWESPNKKWCIKVSTLSSDTGGMKARQSKYYGGVKVALFNIYSDGGYGYAWVELWRFSGKRGNVCRVYGYVPKYVFAKLKQIMRERIVDFDTFRISRM